MVLLDLLHTLAPRHGWKLTVAHLNHQLRGRSSDADERLVRQAAKNLGLPCLAKRANVRQFARTHKLSLEMAARKLRHDFLARTAVRLKLRTILLAHHADDQIELFFLRLFRGGGGEGLAGMKWRNPSPVDPRLELVRPLLDQPKAALRDHALARKIRFREDASNSSPDIQRNRIRHELLPLLRRKYQPALDRTILRFMDITGAEAELAGRVAAQWLSKSAGRAGFLDLPVAVQRRCIQIQLLRRGIAGDYDLVERLRTFPNRKVSVSPEVSAVLTSQGELQSVREKSAQPASAMFAADLNERAEEIVFDGVRIRWRIESRRTPLPPKTVAGRELFDADQVGSKIIVRHWHPGDRFQPIGMDSRVKLQDFFTNQKIAREQRHKLVVVTTEEGELVWVEGLRISERFKLTKGTIRRLHWRWKRL